MQIGNLSRTRHRYEQYDNAAFQALRILLVTGFMASGSLALWLTAGSSASSGGMVTVTPPQILAGEQHVVELPQRTERVQVADADPLALMEASRPLVEASYLPASDQRDSVPASMTADPSPPMGGAVAAAPEPRVSASPPDIDMTGAVAKHASLVEPAPPETSADGLVNLNRASVEQLNSLKGAGALGRAIIKHRPYRSVDDLVKRQIVRRTVFEKIKGQVTVQ
jgi:hypothetical protein